MENLIAGRSVTSNWVLDNEILFCLFLHTVGEADNWLFNRLYIIENAFVAEGAYDSIA